MKERILKLIERDLELLEPHLQKWVKDNLITPKLITGMDLEGHNIRDIWVVTSNKDVSYRVVFDPLTEQFGMEMTLDNGQNWYMGAYGTFRETIESI